MKPQIKVSSITALLATDAYGSILQRCSAQRTNAFAYTPFGHNLNINRLSSMLGFNAQVRDCSGFYLLGNGHRAYSPALSVFLSPDRYSPFDKGGANSYGYCKGDPINYQDPTGETEVHARTLKVIRFYISWDAFEQDNQPRVARHIQPVPTPAQPQDNQPLTRTPNLSTAPQPVQATPSTAVVRNRVADTATENNPRELSPRQAFPAMLRSGLRSIVRRFLPRSQSSAQQLNALPPPVPNSTLRMHLRMQIAREADRHNTTWSVSRTNGSVRTND